MLKLAEQSLVELYSKEKITPAVETRIIQKEDFTKIQPQYCEKVCKLNCKSYEDVKLSSSKVDVLIIQDHDALDDKWKSGEKTEKAHRKIIEELCRRNFSEASRKVVNVLKCKLTSEDLVKGKPPTALKQYKCSPYLKKEIELSQPKVIISLSNNASKAVGVNKSNYTNRGEIYGNVVLTLHPKITLMIRQNASGKMWGPDYWSVIDRDFAKAGKLLRGELTIPTLDTALEKAKKNIRVARNINDVKAFCDELDGLAQNKIISFDTETTGLDPWHSDAKLITIQFGYRNDITKQIVSLVIPLWHKQNKGYDPAEAWKRIVPFLQSQQKKIGHNAKFDILYIYATTGVRVQGLIFDTMLILHNISSGIQGNYSLKRGVWDWFPESGLGGYEERLPSLSTKKQIENDEQTEDV